ncbi:MAG: cadmium-translocating P-type ATPase [Euryarchaeota archaeon]|nr:cadmium-translocating P-type ATPase [Euryarchaeota archaeon]
MHGNHEHSCTVCAAGVHERLPLGTIAAGGLLLLSGIYLEFVLKSYSYAQVLFLLVVLVSGREIISSGIRSALRLRLNINTLITIAAAGAFATGHGEEGAVVVYLFFIAELLEEYASQRARKSISELLALAPEKARVLRDGREELVHVHEVEVGEVVSVKPGERIPLDGVVVSGSSHVNQAPITGESTPVPKHAGMQVFAGTINQEGYLEIRVTKRSEESTLSKIAELVEQAQSRKTRIEAFVDRFARRYTPAVIISAALLAALPPLLLGEPFEKWLYRSLVLLVVACPCALAISTPVSMVSAITSAARNGVLIKGGNFIEALREAKVVVFDKTGTLTTGRIRVAEVVGVDASREEVLRIAGAVEQRSEHPIARAIVEAARALDNLPEVEEFTSLPGRGVEAVIEGRRYIAGSRAFFEELGIAVPEAAAELEARGMSVVLVGSEGRVLGVIGLRDEPRGNAKSTVEALHSSGLRVVMLTGDNRRSAEAIARELGIREFHAELLPQDKLRIVEELQAEGGVVMVGDGVNDAPALARADVGIAMGAAGSDMAIESSDIALMHDDISRITYLLELSRRTMSVVRQNVAASIAIKGSLAVLAFPGLVTLWIAVGVGDMGLSLAVILNALRIARLEAE